MGQLTLRGGAEFQALGTTTKAFNHGDPTQLVAVVGVRLAVRGSRNRPAERSVEGGLLKVRYDPSPAFQLTTTEYGAAGPVADGITIGEMAAQ